MSLGTPQTKNETPTLAGVIQAAIQTELLKLNTCIPAQVEEYSVATGRVSVQPLIKRKYVKDDEVVNLPIINEVPVLFPRSGQVAITFPIKKGDIVLLVFSQRSLERWKDSGGIVEAGNPRHHDLSDAIAIPGVYPATTPLVGASADGLVLQNTAASKITIKDGAIEFAVGAAKINISKDGKFSLGNGVVELMQTFEDTLTRMATILDNILALTVPTGVGPSGPPINSPNFTLDKTDVEALKTKIGQIKL